MHTPEDAAAPPPDHDPQHGGWRENAARWLCQFANLNPDEPISDAGHTTLDWVLHYDVPKLLALIPAPSAVTALLGGKNSEGSSRGQPSADAQERSHDTQHDDGEGR